MPDEKMTLVPVTDQNGVPTAAPTRKTKAVWITALVGPVVSGAVVYLFPSISGDCQGQIIDVVSDLALRGQAADKIIDAACTNELVEAVKVAFIVFANLAWASVRSYFVKNSTAASDAVGR